MYVTMQEIADSPSSGTFSRSLRENIGMENRR